MGTHYSGESRREAVKLSKEIGTQAAADRLGINLKTLYTWIGKSKTRSKMVNELVETKGVDALVREVESLRKQLKESEQEIAILQGAVGFFVKRQKK